MTGLKTLLATRSPLSVPSIYDGISARVAAELGFEAAYIGSYGTGATKYGVPDIGYIGVEDMADQVRRLAPLADVPLVVDAEGGWGNPLHVARSTAILERAGAAAIHIEDHDFGKHLTRDPRCLPTASAVDKFKAALDSRASEDFLIIARTDAAGVEGSEAAVDRLLAYQETGVDALFAAAELDPAAQARLTQEARVPLVMLNFPSYTPQHVSDLGGSMLIYFALAHQVARKAMTEAYASLITTGSAEMAESRWGGGWEALLDFDKFLGIEADRGRAQAWNLIDEVVLPDLEK